MVELSDSARAIYNRMIADSNEGSDVVRIERKELSDEDIIDEVCAWIDRNHISSYHQLCTYVRQQKPSWRHVVYTYVDCFLQYMVEYSSFGSGRHV